MIQYIYYLDSLAAISVPQGLPTTDATDSKIKAVLQVIFIVLGSVALLMVMIGAFKYTISQGDPQSIQSAKNTIMYSVIGLVVALSAWGIVTFALGWIFA